MKRVFTVLLILIAFLLVACGGAEEVIDPTVAPTAEPSSVEEVEAATAVPTEQPPIPTTLDGSMTLEKSAYDPEEAIEVILIVNTPLADDAWVGIVPSDTPHGSELENDAVDISYQYIIYATEDNRITLYAPVDPGLYDVRLFNTDGSSGVELASVSITVGDVEPASAEEAAPAASAEEATDSEEAADEETAVSDASDAGSNCIVGTWRLENMAEYLEVTMQSSIPEGSNLSVSAETSGDLLITFTDSDMSMSSNDYAVIVTMAGQTVPVAVTAEGTASYQADGNTISNIVTDYDSTAAAGGTAVSIDMAWLTAAGVEGGSVTYSCDATSMTWTEPYTIPIQFARVDS